MVYRKNIHGGGQKIKQGILKLFNEDDPHEDISYLREKMPSSNVAEGKDMKIEFEIFNRFQQVVTARSMDVKCSVGLFLDSL